MPMNMNMGMNMGMQNQQQFPPNHQMMVPQMMAMNGMNGMDQMGMMSWPGAPGMNMGMMGGPSGFQHGGPQPGFNPMQMQQMQGMQGVQGMQGMPMQGMSMGWMGGPDPNFGGEGVWNPAMMGIPGQHNLNMGMNGMPMDMSQWGPFGFQ